jgi:hypothetical protein
MSPNPPARWNVGLHFSADGIAVGTAGIANAIQMGPAQRIAWYLGHNNLGTSIYMGNAGNLNLDVTGGHTIATNGSNGVSCSGGINSSSFRSVNGLVTAC